MVKFECWINTFQDEDEDDHGSSGNGRSGRGRRNKFGRKKSGKKSGSKNTPFTVVRSSSLAQLLLHTFALCCVFFAIVIEKKNFSFCKKNLNIIK